MKDIFFCIRTSSALTDDINKTKNGNTILLENKTYDEVKQTIDKNQNICNQSLRPTKQKKFHHLMFKLKKPQQFRTTKNENIPTESFDSNKTRERSETVALKKGNS